MSDIIIPRTPQDLTPEWLTAALRGTGAITNSKVTSIEVQGDIAAGAGFMGQLARVTLAYDQPEPDAPTRIIAKFPTYEPGNRAIADMFRMYETETRFYEEIATRTEMRTPRRYHSARADDCTDFILLMEDLSPARVGDQVVGCARENARLAVSELAKFHATWWESPALADLDWVWPFNYPVRVAAAQGAYAQSWGPFKEMWGSKTPEVLLDLGERFHDALPGLLDALAEHPVTISHGDYRLDNLFFATPEGGDPLAVVDWQIMTIGKGAFDLAYFMAGAMPVADRREWEMDLLRLYHDTLTERGVKGYTFDQFLFEFRTAALFCWQYAVIILGALDAANERGLDLFSGIFDRFVALLLDHNAAELLPG